MLPASARCVALVALNTQRTSAGDSPRRLLALLDAALKQEASIALVCEHPPEDLPLQVEVQPPEALADVCQWADYVAFEMRRESLPELRGKIGKGGSLKSMSEAQALVQAPMPCGGLAECGVCTVEVHGGHQLACVDGPVFDLRQLIG
jgi:dihydroorotate dehydrogenase electron transfer subunit